MKALTPRAVLTLLLVCAGTSGTRAADAEAALLVLKNQSLTLGFDRRTGGWISLIEQRTASSRS